MPTTIERLVPWQRKLRFYLKDADGIHQLRLLVKPTNKNPPPGYQSSTDPEENKANWKSRHQEKKYVLHDYRTIRTELEATVEFEYPKIVKNQIHVQMIDGIGNTVYREMNLVERR